MVALVIVFMLEARGKVCDCLILGSLQGVDLVIGVLKRPIGRL